MGEREFSTGSNGGPVSLRSWDWNLATLIEIKFASTEVNIGIPNDITAEQMAVALEDAAKGLREGGKHFYLPMTYAIDRKNYINRLQEEEARVGV